MVSGSGGRGPRVEGSGLARVGEARVYKPREGKVVKSYTERTFTDAELVEWRRVRELCAAVGGEGASVHDQVELFFSLGHAM